MLNKVIDYSSFITNVKLSKGVLVVTMTSGTYQYNHVPKSVFYALVNSQNIGKTFVKLLKMGNYSYRKLN